MKSRSMTAILIFGLIRSLCLASSSDAESADDTLARKGTGQLRILADIDSAIVLLGGHVVGKTPFVAESLYAGTYEVKILHPDVANWVTPTISDTIRLFSGETVARRYTLTGGIVVQSVPDGAAVVFQDSILGLTPLVLLAGRPSRSSMLQLQKAGYEPVFVDLTLAKGGVLKVPLLPQPGSSAEGDDIVLVGTGGRDGRATRLYISGAVALVSGIASAYFKITADERQMEYSATGDPSLMWERKRLDTAAGISFAVLQVSIALFWYFLTSD